MVRIGSKGITQRGQKMVGWMLQRKAELFNRLQLTKTELRVELAKPRWERHVIYQPTQSENIWTDNTEHFNPPSRLPAKTSELIKPLKSSATA
jgi:hypothetical protein